LSQKVLIGGSPLGCGNDTRIAKIKDMGFTGHTLNKRPALVRGLMNDELQRERCTNIQKKHETRGIIPG
jgi:hypothetical protein